MKLFGRHKASTAADSRLMIELTGVVWPEGGQWVSQCVEIDVSSFGASPEEAMEELKDAICSYLNTVEELGEREQSLEQAGVPVYHLAPQTVRMDVPRELLDHPGSQVRPFDLPLGDKHLALA